MKKLRFIYIPLIIFALGFFPLLLGIAAGTFASYHGCRLHEGFPEPCLVNGEDYGQFLYTFAVLPWLTLATLPIAGFLFLIWILVEILVFIRKKRKSKMPLNKA